MQLDELKIWYYDRGNNSAQGDDEYIPFSKYTNSKNIKMFRDRSNRKIDFEKLKNFGTNVFMDRHGVGIEMECKKLTSMNIKTFGLQHGWPWNGECHTRVATDYLFCWSDLCKQKLTSWGVDPEKLIITGAPRFDNLVGIKENKKFNKIPIIGFCSVPFYAGGGYADMPYTKYYARSVYSLNPKYFPKIIHRLHPLESFKMTRFKDEYMKMDKLDNVIIEHADQRSLTEFLNEIDILVTCQSGTIIASNAIGVPSVAMNYFDKPLNVDEKGYELSEIVTDPKNLTKAICNAYGRMGNVDMELLHKYNAHFDGSCSGRVIYEILKRM